MIRAIGVDHRISWPGSRPSEHGSQAELCFKARFELRRRARQATPAH
jgi:hypothetical protein